MSTASGIEPSPCSARSVSSDLVVIGNRPAQIFDPPRQNSSKVIGGKSLIESCSTGLEEHALSLVLDQLRVLFRLSSHEHRARLRQDDLALCSKLSPGVHHSIPIPGKTR